MRKVKKGVGQDNYDLCRTIEEKLFQACGKDPTKYIGRARSLVSNLGAGDGGLLKRVLDGEVEPSALVKMGVEDWAPDALKDWRKKELERYFHSEVHDVSGPPNRREDLLFPRLRDSSPDYSQELRDSAPHYSQEDGRAPLVAQADNKGDEDGVDDHVTVSRETSALVDNLSDDEGSSSGEDSYSESSSSPEEAVATERLVGALLGTGGGSSHNERQLVEDLDMARALQAASPSSPSCPSSPSSSPPRAGERVPKVVLRGRSTTSYPACGVHQADELGAPRRAGTSRSYGARTRRVASVNHDGELAREAQQRESEAVIEAELDRFFGPAALLEADFDAPFESVVVSEAAVVGSQSPSGSSSSGPSSPSGSPTRIAVSMAAGREQLLAMGFAGFAAEEALAKAGGNVEHAVSALCASHP